MIQEDYVSLETALKLKEKGFPLKYETEIYEREEPWSGFTEEIEEVNTDKPILPTLSLVSKWLREEKNINIDVSILVDYNKVKRQFIFLGYYYNVSKIFKKTNYMKSLFSSYSSYYQTFQLYKKQEEALEAGINKALELI